MAITIIEQTDAIEVQFVPILYFGPSGSEKTTLAQTANEPFTIDADRGIHRARNRRRSGQVDTWDDMLEMTHGREVANCQTIVVDTLGRVLDLMIPPILAESSKYGYQGNLSPSGWGVLGGRFTTWIKTVRALGKDLIMVCHQEDSKDAAGNSEVFPDMPGRMSYKEVHKFCDMIGRIRYEGKRKFLDFSPAEGATCCKNAAGLDPILMPDLSKSKTFMADLIVEIKKRVGKTSEASAAAARIVTDWRDRIAAVKTLDAFNAMLPEMGKYKNGIKAQMWALVQAHAKECELTFDQAAKKFVQQPVVNGEAEEVQQ